MSLVGVVLRSADLGADRSTSARTQDGSEIEDLAFSAERHDPVGQFLGL